jgi:photosystem II stability/assembly factor-like uncharacterized protein
MARRWLEHTADKRSASHTGRVLQMVRFGRRPVPIIVGIALLCALVGAGAYRFAFADTPDQWVVRSVSDPPGYSVPAPPPTDSRWVTIDYGYRGVSAVDSRTAYAVGWFRDGDEGIVRPLWGRTTNGTDWSIPASVTSYAGELKAVDALGVDDVWAVGDAGLVLHWDGATWNRSAAGVTTATLNGVAFVDASNGWAVGSGATILRTVNGGSSWTTQTVTGLASDLYAISATGPNYAIAVGALGKAAKWNGTTWTTSGMATGTSEDLLSVDLLDTTHGFAVGKNGTFLRWQGGTWMTPSSKELWSGYSNNVRAVTVANASYGLAVGDYGMVWRTVDGGTTWWVDQVQANEGNFDIDRAGADTAPDDATRVWVVGDSDARHQQGPLLLRPCLRGHA